MVKTSAIFSAHALHVLLRNTLISFIVIGIALFFWLKVGIEANHLKIGNYKIDKLYLKLNKKLTLKAKNVFIPKEKEKSSFNKVDKRFDQMKYLFTFFDEISLENIYFQNNTYRFKFFQNLLNIQSDEYEISGIIYRNNTLLTAEVKRLYLKEKDIYLDGNVSYDISTERLVSQGHIDAYDIHGMFKCTKEHDDITLEMHTNRFAHLDKLIEPLTLHPKVKAWILKRVEAKGYTLNHLSAKAKLNKKGLVIDFDTLKASGRLDDVRILYNKKLSEVLAKHMDLIYKNKGLYFDLIEPSYKGRSLKGSRMSITHLGKHAHLLLDLKIKTQIDQVLKNVLHAYSIKLPLTFKGKEASKVDVNLDIPLGKKRKDKKIKVCVDVALPKGKLSLSKLDLMVKKAKAHYEKGKIKLDATLKDKHYHAQVKGSVTLAQKIVDLDVKVKKLTFSDNNMALFMQDKLIPIHIDYSNQTTVTLRTLGIDIVSNEKTTTYSLHSLKKIKPYLKQIPFDFQDGMLKIHSNKENGYRFDGQLKRRECFFFGEDTQCYTHFPFEGSFTRKGLSFYAFDKKLHYSSLSSRIDLKHLHIDIKKLLAMHKKSSLQENQKLVIIGKDSQLRYGKYKLITDSYDIELAKKGDIKAVGSLHGDIVNFAIHAHKVNLDAYRIGDRMLHPLIGFNGLYNGRYTLNLNGIPEEEMKGHIIIEGGVMRDFKAYNNTLALINTLPALATLHNPGFSSHGFKIVEGVIDYHILKRHLVVFDSIYLKGESATLVGKGTLDIEKNTININLALQTARELGKIVGNLPLLGYILMGEDKSFTVGLHIGGSLSEPEVKTSATKDILSLPFDFIKRTLQSPAHIINK